MPLTPLNYSTAVRENNKLYLNGMVMKYEQPVQISSYLDDCQVMDSCEQFCAFVDGIVFR